MSRLIPRDPFAREELHRERVYLSSGYTCVWCGNVHETNAGKRYLFAYHTETDGGRRFEHRGLFCSKSCHDAYH
jgi:hypothetical protein